jgi:hypothetical protein
MAVGFPCITKRNVSPFTFFSSSSDTFSVLILLISLTNSITALSVYFFYREVDFNFETYLPAHDGTCTIRPAVLFS